MIHHNKFDFKDDSVLQISSQEPTMSFNYNYVHDTLNIMLGSWKFEYKSWMTNYVDSDVKNDIRNYPILQLSSQESSMSSKYDCVTDALIIMLGS